MRDISIQLQDAGAVDHLDGGTGRELTPRIFHGSTGYFAFCSGPIRSARAIRLRDFSANSIGWMVLPVGIEPTTSPLPRECSTTELRQRPAR